MKLPVPDQDIPILGDAVEGFIQWPVNAITRFTGRSKTPTLKEQTKGVPPQLRQGHITTSPGATIGPAIDQVILKGHGNTKELTKRTVAKPTKVTTVINKKLPKNSTTKTYVKIVQPDHQQGPFTNRRSPTIVNDINVVKKEKIAYRIKLTSLKSDIDANRSVVVKDGYNRWMSREDCAEPYTILVNKEIFRQSEDYMFSLNASDIIELLTYEDLETDILTLFAMSLYRLKGRSKNTKTGFVNPAMITSHAYIYDQFNTLDYLAQTLDGGSLSYEFYLAPYLQGIIGCFS